MPLDTNIEFRKRRKLNRIVRQQQKMVTIPNESAEAIIEKLCHYLTAPRNFSNLNTTLSWFDKYIAEQSQETQLFLITFFETCLVRYEQEGGNWKVIEDLKKELREKGKSEEEINEVIARGH